METDDAHISNFFLSIYRQINIIINDLTRSNNNFFHFQIVGVALLSIGTIFFTQELETNLDADTSALATETDDAVRALKQGALFFLITGVIAIVLAVLGCIGAIKESHLLMRVVSDVILCFTSFESISSNGDSCFI